MSSIASVREKPVPTYRKHKQSGQGIVTLTDGVGNRRDVLLGKYGTRASRVEYARVIAEWEACDRRLPSAVAADMTVAELIDAYWPHCERHYRHADGTPTGEARDYVYSLRPVDFLYGDKPAKDFGPLELQAVRQLMVRGYVHPKYGEQPALSRGVVNQRIARICRVWKWGVSQRLVPGVLLTELKAVSGLQRGRSEARETDPVLPVARAVVEETLPHMRPMTADMVRLQLETGMRSGELVIMRGCDIDMTGDVWLYRPSHHKNEHRGHSRVVPIGPKAQAIVSRYLKLDTTAFLFSPADCVTQHQEEKRRNRKSKVQPSQVNRKKRRPKRRAGARYTVDTYGNAIDRACEKAWPPPDHLGPQNSESIKARRKRMTPDERAELAAWRKSHSWHPHQLRHTRALELKRQLGLDVARAVLGHKSPVIAEHYAGLDVATAAAAMKRLG
jgi:integrase